MKSNRLNQKSTSSTKTVVNDGNKSYYIFARGVKVYPIYKNGKFQIQVDNNNRLRTFEKQLSQKEINEAIAKTVNYYYDKLKEEEFKNSIKNGTNKRN